MLSGALIFNVNYPNIAKTIVKHDKPIIKHSKHSAMLNRIFYYRWLYCFFPVPRNLRQT